MNYNSIYNQPQSRKNHKNIEQSRYKDSYRNTKSQWDEPYESRESRKNNQPLGKGNQGGNNPYEDDPDEVKPDEGNPIPRDPNPQPLNPSRSKTEN